MAGQVRQPHPSGVASHPQNRVPPPIPVALVKVFPPLPLGLLHRFDNRFPARPPAPRPLRGSLPLVPLAFLERWLAISRPPQTPARHEPLPGILSQPLTNGSLRILAHRPVLFPFPTAPAQSSQLLDLKPGRRGSVTRHRAIGTPAILAQNFQPAAHDFGLGSFSQPFGQCLAPPLIQTQAH